MKKPGWLWLVPIVLIIGGALYLLLAPGPSDADQIRTALRESIKASKEGRPGGVIEYLSDSFTVNGQSYGNTAQIAQTIRQYKPDVTVESDDPVVVGDVATITTPVTLEQSLMHVSLKVSSVTFTFHREAGTSWLIIPTKRWKLEGVSIPPEVIQQVSSQFE